MFRYILVLILVMHSAVTFLALKDASIWSVFPPFRENFVYQIFSDLVSASGVIFLLIYYQLKKKGWPLTGLIGTVIGTILVGTFSPLIYLLYKKDLFE